MQLFGKKRDLLDMKSKYLDIVSHYERCFDKYGDTHKGMDWPNAKDLDIRHQVMLELIKPIEGKKAKVLDFGCGTSSFYEYLIKNDLQFIEYSGLDLSKKFIEVSKKKFPVNVYFYGDIFIDNMDIPQQDYIVMNGVFTEKQNLNFDEMFEHMKRLLLKVNSYVHKGFAFNVMSPCVDWKKEEAFHLSFEQLGHFINNEISKKFIFRHDYGLYEYTTYVYK